jgi:hypothetical protein
MRSVDAMAAQNGDVAPPGREGRMQRQMERQMGGIRWNLDKWAKSFPGGVSEMTRVILPTAPMTAATSAINPADIVRQLVTDPTFQLK